jgi:hypothetical protein
VDVRAKSGELTRIFRVFPLNVRRSDHGSSLHEVTCDMCGERIEVRVDSIGHTTRKRRLWLWRGCRWQPARSSFSTFAETGQPPSNRTYRPPGSPNLGSAQAPSSLEFAGPTFSADGKPLFAGIQNLRIVFAIKGP